MKLSIEPDNRARFARLDALIARGFDDSYSKDTISINVVCSQCDAMVINGTACHETGCPNTRHECKGCNKQIPIRQRYCADCA